MDSTEKTEMLNFSKILTENHSYYWDDLLIARAYKTDAQTKKKLPLDKNWRQSPILKGVENGQYRHLTESGKFIGLKEYQELNYRDQFQYAPCRDYQLNHAALKWIDNQSDHKSILNDIRITVKDNHFDIILSNILIAEAPTSRLKLIVETIKALAGSGVLKGNWSKESEKTRPYKILQDYFHIDKYEVRIDSGRYGVPFLYSCKRNSEWTGVLKKINKKQAGKFNQVPFFSPEKLAIKQRGYNMVVYDRFNKPENEKGDPGQFPVRLEVKLHKKLLKGTISQIKGNAEKIIKKFESDIEKIILTGLKKMKSPETIRNFDIFINGGKTKKTPAESFRNLIKKGSFLNAIENIQDRVSNIEKTLEYHGLELPKQRGLKVI
jgi:hypothetical protein